MYKDFYGFTTYPFALTPDPQFLYPSESYKGCLSYLLGGLERGYGLLVLTGEIGTGKTFLLNTLVKRLDEKIHIASLVYSNLKPFGMLQYVCREFNLEIAGKSKAKLLIALKNFLKTHAMMGEKVIVIVDEAQNLSVDVLEDLRLLTNFESPEKRALQIILVGQPQLEGILKLPELTQLRQRVERSCRLLPMSYEETKSYIEERLVVAGVAYPVFTAKAIKKIFACSRGIPRAVNLICDLALVFGCSNKEREIEHTVIKKVMKGLNLYTSEKPTSHHTRQKRDANGVHANRFRRPRHLALIADIAAFSLLSIGVVLQGFLASKKFMEDTPKSVPSPSVVLPQSPSVREPPLLPQSPSVREPPLLPLKSGYISQSDK